MVAAGTDNEVLASSPGGRPALRAGHRAAQRPRRAIRHGTSRFPGAPIPAQRTAGRERTPRAGPASRRMQLMLLKHNSAGSAGESPAADRHGPLGILNIDAERARSVSGQAPAPVPRSRSRSIGLATFRPPSWAASPRCTPVAARDHAARRLASLGRLSPIFRLGTGGRRHRPMKYIACRRHLLVHASFNQRQGVSP